MSTDVIITKGNCSMLLFQNAVAEADCYLIMIWLCLHIAKAELVVVSDTYGYRLIDKQRSHAI